MLAALAALDRRRDVDGSRIALAGGSYGGYLAALLPGMSDRFKASVVHAGVFDLTQQFASDAHWDRPSSYGNAPWTDPVELDRWSPSRLSPKFATPTLILHGEKDYRVPVTQGINLYGVLTGKGVPARIVIFPEENHWIAKPQASLLWHREFFAWLDRYVVPGPQPTR
jgi:dipeptidyl aminopeptidase/acylaminoacyl peptidase